MRRRILVVKVAALGSGLMLEHLGRTHFHGCPIHTAEPIFPALTCPAQASFRTASLPSDHGMVFNGMYSRRLRRPSFWEQSSALVQGQRLWQKYREGGGRVGLCFWQQSLGEDVDVLLSPWPIHTHGGRLVDSVYSFPNGLYERIVAALKGKPFRLRYYWGPLASRAASQWITSATEALLDMVDIRPDLLLTYLPHLDYALQRHGPHSAQANRSVRELSDMLSRLHNAADRSGYEMVVIGDYAIGDAVGAVLPNRILREAGLLRVRTVRGRKYPNIHESRAFAVVDHEVAHVYISSRADVQLVANSLRDEQKRYDVLGLEEMMERGIQHHNSGELLLVSRPERGYWFAYPWWSSSDQAPDYAGHVDIHNKPGYDPCELFWGWPPPKVSQDNRRIRGTHGAAGEGRKVAWWSTMELCSGEAPNHVLTIASLLRRTLEIS